MPEKLAELGLERDPDFLYFVRRGDVWRVARPGSEAETTSLRPELVIATEAAGHPSFICYVDADGDLARVRRSASSAKRYKKRASRATS